MESSIDTFRRWTDCLCDSTKAPRDHWEAAHEWCSWGLKLLGVDESYSHATADDFFADSILSTGKAISPLGAARCVREYRRTAVFLQAMDAAIRAARVRFPGETIHVLEAGCGPLAPLALPFALRYAPEEVSFTLLDLHPRAMNGARKVASELGLSASVRNWLVADATTIRFKEADRPHVIACEVLLRALKREPQVAVTMNLAPQLREGGFFLPERIDVDACLFDSGEYFRPRPEALELAALRAASISELGRVFRLEAESVAQLQPCGVGRLAAEAVVVPPHCRRRLPLHLFTRIKVFCDHVLGDFESSLNLPERVCGAECLSERGGVARFVYEIARDPGLRLLA